MPPAGFEPTISADERPQTYSLDRAAAGTSFPSWILIQIGKIFIKQRQLFFRILQLSL
jgi:hypothetical protein